MATTDCVVFDKPRGPREGMHGSALETFQPTPVSGQLKRLPDVFHICYSGTTKETLMDISTFMCEQPDVFARKHRKKLASDVSSLK